MNKNIDFTLPGGLPVTQRVTAFMQSAYQESLNALTSLCGGNVIVSGIMVAGSNVSDGWIAYNGELIPFLGGIKQATFVIVDDVINLRFFDEVERPALFTRYARFGAGPNNFDALIRLDSILALKQNAEVISLSLQQLTDAVNDHKADIGNPHHVTKDQVGLSNIPNNKSDDPMAGDSNILATTLATLNLYDSINTIYHKGSAFIGDVSSDKLVAVNHNLNLASYLAIGNLRGAGDWNANNDVMAVVTSVNPNSFSVAIREVASQVQNLYFDYIIIKMP